MTPIACALVCAVAVAEWGPIRVDAEGVPLPPGVLARIGSTRMRHDGWLSEIHFTADGRKILGLHDANTLSTWDARTGRRLRVDWLPGYLHRSSALRSDGRLVYATMPQGGGATPISLRTFEVESGAVATVKTFDEGSPSISADGTCLAVRTNGLVRVYETRTGKAVGELRLSISDYDPVKLVISHDNKLLAAAYTGWLEVREIATGNVAYSGTPPLHTQYHEAVFSPDGRELCCVVEKKRGYVVEAIELKTEKRVELTSCDSFYFPTYSWNGQTLYGIRNSELVRIERATNSITVLGKGFSRATAAPLVLSPDGSALAVGGIRYRLTLHDPKTGRRLPPTEDRFEAAASTIEYTADGTKLAFNSDAEDDGLLADVATGKVLKTVPYDDSSCHFFPDGKRYALATGKRLEVRSLANDVSEFRADLDLPWPPSLRTAQGGKQVLALGQQHLHRWDTGTRSKLKSHPASGYERYTTPDGRYAVLCPEYGSTHPPEVQLLDLATGAFHPGWPKLQDHRDDRVWYVQFDPPSRLAVLVQPARLTLVDLSTFEVRRLPIRAGNGQACLPAFSPDSRTLAVVHEDERAVKLCETSSGLVRQTIPLTDLAISLAFSPDTRTLAIHSTTAPVHLHDLRGTLLTLPRLLDGDALTACWKSLHGRDGPGAFLALRKLAAAPASTVPFIRERVRPATGIPGEVIAARIEALDSPAFAEREKATAELQRFADLVEGELRSTEKATPSTEVRQRLEKILEHLRPDSPESVRRSRIVEVIEWCGTPDAKKLLQEWAAGASGAALTRQAKEALARWKQ